MTAPAPTPLPHRQRCGRPRGFTLIELMVTLSITGTLLAVALFGWSSWAAASEHQQAAQQVESQLRRIQQQAVTEGSSMCVDFDTTAGSWSAWRGRCDDPDRTAVGASEQLPTGLDISTATFAYPDTTRDAVTFTPRGTASAGTVTITRTDTTRDRTVTVEGLTGRVVTD